MRGAGENAGFSEDCRVYYGRPERAGDQAAIHEVHVDAFPTAAEAELVTHCAPQGSCGRQELVAIDPGREDLVAVAVAQQR